MSRYLMNGTAARERIVELARAEGFALIGFAPAGEMPGPREAALAAFREGRLAEMAWMTPEWLVHATNPGAFLPGARTVIVLALPCHAPDPISPHPSSLTASRGRVARYARGRDYHRVFEKKLRRIARTLRDELGAAARATVDYGPLLERPLAVLAGAGWQGKSAMLLVPGFGPWVMLGAIATDLEVEPGAPLRKSCGSCTRCLAACPTGALSPAGHVLDSRLCISYHTIENRGPIPHALRPKFGDWIFGCDECLDSCPVGAARFESHPDFAAWRFDDAFPPLAELLALDDQAFAERFRGRAIMRAKRDGLLRNVCVALGNVGTAPDFAALAAALDDHSPLVRGHAAWGLGRLAAREALEPEAAAALEARLAMEEDPFVRNELTTALGNLVATQRSEP
ncbi:tRNA epoxyqueuosine(34) reductase QueG [bacterium]|nr:MAG: tRNA epoxyqueuosine(34) reductase QueG [bacterium]